MKPEIRTTEYRDPLIGAAAYQKAGERVVVCRGHAAYTLPDGTTVSGPRAMILDSERRCRMIVVSRR